MTPEERCAFLAKANRNIASRNVDLANDVAAAQEELRLCQQDAIQLQDRLSAVEQALNDEIARNASAEVALDERLEAAERDRDAGWKAFYALRKQVGEDRYPGLTNVVRTTDQQSVTP